MSGENTKAEGMADKTLSQKPVDLAPCLVLLLTNSMTLGSHLPSVQLFFLLQLETKIPIFCRGLL